MAACRLPELSCPDSRPGVPAAPSPTDGGARPPSRALTDAQPSPRPHERRSSICLFKPQGETEVASLSAGSPRC